MLSLVSALTMGVGAMWPHATPAGLTPHAARHIAARRATPASVVPSGFVTRSGAQLELDGRPLRLVGVNAYELATLWSVNKGCGGQIDDLGALFASLPPHSVVRFWAYQAQAVDWRAGTIDFGPIDRVVAAAAAHHDELIVTLSDQSGTCDDGHWHDQAWYDGGYKKVWNDDGRGLDHLSFSDWMKLIVNRYKGSPAVGMWELVNEPEASDCAPGFHGSACYGHLACPPGAARSLRSFFDTVGAELERIDQRHLLASGAIGGGQCGMAGPDFSYVNASPAVDVLTYHDYGADGQAMPTPLAEDLAAARALHKPLVDEEVGIAGSGTGGTCDSLAGRAGQLRAKADAAFRAGAAGFLPWDWVGNGAGGCQYDVLPGDPALGMLARAAMSARAR
ncbi:MAG: beta-mannosidase [Acidimicrobiales bacterium]